MPRNYVNCYSVSRQYGGPEEGGWYYDEFTPLASVKLPDNTPQAIIETVRLKMLDRYAGERTSCGRLGRYSVLGGSDVEVYVEDAPPKASPEDTPHYE